MKNALTLSNVSHKFSDTVVLNDVSLSIAPGTIHTLIGTTGVGKSLLLRLISNLTVLQNGHIDTNNEKISYVFQNNSFFSWLTIEKNLELSSNLKIKEMEILVKRFKLEEYLKMYPKYLSGGTGQKFNLLRAFVNRSNIVLMDEPFSHLDVIQREDLYNFTLELWKEYRPTILLVTHDIDEALYLSDKISFLSRKEKNIKYTLEIENRHSNGNTKSLVTERAKDHYLRDFKILYNYLSEDLV
ncbi:MAG: ABC transporter ATP-binding protein [Rhizobacter sp.]|nr:ABC transporter ATP-binding protein [Bacteriovorax sp.]